MADPTPLIQILRTPPSSDGPAAQSPGVGSPRLSTGGPTTRLSPTVEWPAIAERMRASAAARERRLAAEQCEMCGAGIEAEHGHVVNLPGRTLLCVCRPCYLLFTHEGAGGARFRPVPHRYHALPEFAAARDGWEALQIPIGLAFFFRNSATARTTAFYPSPAGATESELPLEAWDAVVRAVPPLSTLAADVEALLVRRREEEIDALIVPIDACYELVGRIRQTWRGFHGGDEVWREIDEFFTRATDRARGGPLV